MKMLIMAIITVILITGCNNSRNTGGKVKTPLEHSRGKGKVTIKPVNQSHKKDYMVQDKYQVSFVNNWKDERNGFIYCGSSPCMEATAKTFTKDPGTVPHTDVE